jgi:Flp pilus assembly protein TadB
MRASTFIIILCAVAAITTLGFFASDVSKNMTKQEDARSAALQAQSNAQIEAARQQSIQQAQTAEQKNYVAQLNAQSVTQTTNAMSMIGMLAVAVVLILVVAGSIIWGVNWADNKQTTRNIMYLQQQQVMNQQALQAHQYYLLSQGKNMATPTNENQMVVWDIPSIVNQEKRK